MKPPASDDRNARRARVVIQAKLRIIGGKGFDVTVTALDAEGCAFIKPNVMLREKQKVAIKLDTLDFVPAIVRHASDEEGEIEFERPLYGPVVEHLLRSHR